MRGISLKQIQLFAMILGFFGSMYDTKFWIGGGLFAWWMFFFSSWWQIHTHINKYVYITYMYFFTIRYLFVWYFSFCESSLVWSVYLYIYINLYIYIFLNLYLYIYRDCLLHFEISPLCSCYMFICYTFFMFNIFTFYWECFKLCNCMFIYIYIWTVGNLLWTYCMFLCIENLVYFSTKIQYRIQLYKCIAQTHVYIYISTFLHFIGLISLLRTTDSQLFGDQAPFFRQFQLLFNDTAGVDGKF